MSFIQIGFLGASRHWRFRSSSISCSASGPSGSSWGRCASCAIVLEHNARRRRVMRWLLLDAAAGVRGVAGVSVRPAVSAGVAAGGREANGGRADRPVGDDGAEAAGRRAGDRAGGGRRRRSCSPRPARTRGLKSPSSIMRSIRCSKPRRDAEEVGKPRDPARSELLAKLVAPEACYGGDRLRRGPGMGSRRAGQGARRPAAAARLHRFPAERPGLERGRCAARRRDDPSARPGPLGRQQRGRHRGPARAGLAAAGRADLAARDGLQRRPVHRD